MRSIVLALLTIALCNIEAKSRDDLLRDEGQAIYEKCVRIAAQFYTLGTGEELKEITQAILDSPDTKEPIKQAIASTGRRFFLFHYPSDGYQVKGTISFVPNGEKHNLLILLRGGTGVFGLMHPATDFTCTRDYTVIATAYRGGVSEGIDEFGGDEVSDVPNLLSFFPTLGEKLGVDFQPKNTYLLGGSRGGMEMFLALARFPKLQQQITKAASLSGLLDLEECMLYREGMKNMFVREFGLILDKNKEEWVHRRNPIDTAAHLRKDLPFLIVQGSDDLRVHVNEGRNMVRALQSQGNQIDYWEIEGADHCLSNQSNRMERIAEWFEAAHCR